MPDNRSNQRNDNARNDNDAFGGSTRSGRGGSWSNRDDEDMLNRNARGGRSRSGYDSELNDQMERGGSHTSAYGDEHSASGDRYRDPEGRGGNNQQRNMRDRGNSDRDMGADSWGGSSDRDTGRDRYNRQDRYSAGGSYNNRDSELEDERNDYYGNRGMSNSDRGRASRSSNLDDFNEEIEWSRGRSAEGMRNAGGPQRAQNSRGGYSDRYSGREGGSNQFSSWQNEPSDMSTGSRGGRDSMQQRNYGSQADRQTGQHAGRGPKGYRRDDARITEDINEALTHDAHIDASEIEVQVSGGEVTLTGTVDNRDAKRHAEDIAERISGVSDVNNQIRVSKSGANAYSRSSSDSDRMSGRSSSDRSTMNSDQNPDRKASNKSGAKDGTSTADGAMSAQGTGPSGASNTSTSNTNPVPKSIPGTQGTSSHKTGDKGAQ